MKTIGYVGFGFLLILAAGLIIYAAGTLIGVYGIAVVGFIFALATLSSVAMSWSD